MDQSQTQILLVDSDAEFFNAFQKIASENKIEIKRGESFDSIKKDLLSTDFSAICITDNYLENQARTELLSWAREFFSDSLLRVLILSEDDKHKPLQEPPYHFEPIHYIIKKPFNKLSIVQFFNILLKKNGDDTSEYDFLKELKNEYHASISTKINFFEETAQKINPENFIEHLTELKFNLHKIAGSAGSLGYIEAGLFCKEVEQSLICFENGNSLFSSKAWVTYFEKIFIPQIRAAFAEDEENPLFSKKEKTTTSKKHDIYILCEDSLRKDLIKESSIQQLSVEGDSCPNAFKEQLTNPKFSSRIILLDLKLFTSEEELNTVFSLYKKHHPQAGTIFGLLCNQGDMSKRMKASYLGADIFIELPIVASKLLAECKYFLDAEKYKVLIIDDDPDIHYFFKKIFEEMPFEIKSLNEGKELFETIDTFQPDLVILDIELPEYNGLELLKALRIDMSYQHIPIIIISVHSSSVYIEECLNSGANDFINKPLDPTILKIKIPNLLKSYKTQAHYRDRDQLTFLLNRRGFIDSFHKTVKRTIRLESTFSLALLDIDDFKDVNSKYGYHIGDQVLTNFTQFLKNHLRRTDTLARWGGEEFVILFEGCPAKPALSILSKIIEELTTTQFFNEHPGLVVTFSCGIVSFPEQGDSLNVLMDTAEEALTIAKNSGKRQALLSQVNS